MVYAAIFSGKPLSVIHFEEHGYMAIAQGNQAVPIEKGRFVMCRCGMNYFEWTIKSVIKVLPTKEKPKHFCLFLPLIKASEEQNQSMHYFTFVTTEWE